MVRNSEYLVTCKYMTHYNILLTILTSLTLSASIKSEHRQINSTFATLQTSDLKTVLKSVLNSNSRLSSSDSSTYCSIFKSQDV